MSLDLDIQIRNLYEDIETRQEPITFDEIMTTRVPVVDVRAPAGRLPRRRGWVVALATAAAVLLVALVVLVAQQQSSDPPVINQPDPTPGLDFAPSDLGSGWTKVASGVELLGSTGVDLGKIVVAGPGLVVSGEACDKTAPVEGAEGFSTGTVCGPIILTSVDGQTWARVADDPFGAGLINDVAAYGSGAVAVGSTCTLSLAQVSPDCAPAVWISADGLSWTRIDDDAVFAGCVDCGFETSVEIYSVAVAGTRVVAVGRNTAGSAAWVSDDGTAWRLSQTGKTFAGISGPDRVAVSGSGFVAWGIECGNVIENGEAVGFDCSTATWISQDGTEWDRQAADYGSFAFVYDRAPFGSGVVGVGLVTPLDLVHADDSGEHAAAWFSPDGLDWTRAQVEDQAAGTMHRVISSGTWLVAFSGELPEGRTVIWVSSDGQNWSRAPIDPPELATAHVSSATFTPSGIVVLGRDHTRNEGKAIWSWTPPTP